MESHIFMPLSWNGFDMLTRLTCINILHSDPFISVPLTLITIQAINMKRTLVLGFATLVCSLVLRWGLA